MSATGRARDPETLGVVLCTHNGGRFLAAQLESIAEQTRLPDAVLVLDDRSDDDTVAQLEAFARTAPIPVSVLVNERRLGAAANFERGIAQCDAEVIALADQDDVWHPTKLERLAAEIDAGAVLAFSDADLVDEHGARLDASAWQVIGFDADARATFARDPFAFLLRKRVATGATMAFEARIRAMVLPFPEFVRDPSRPWVIHDGWISLLAAAVGHVQAVPERLISYRHHKGQQMGLPVEGPRARPEARRTAADRAARLEQLASYLDEVERRLAAGLPATAGAQATLGACRRHYRRRAAMSAAGAPRRAATVAAELLKRGYHDHSDGVRSAFRDLVRW